MISGRTMPVVDLRVSSQSAQVASVQRKRRLASAGSSLRVYRIPCCGSRDTVLWVALKVAENPNRKRPVSGTGVVEVLSETAHFIGYLRASANRGIQQTPDDRPVKRAPKIVAVGGHWIKRPVSNARQLGAG